MVVRVVRYEGKGVAWIGATGQNCGVRTSGAALTRDHVPREAEQVACAQSAPFTSLADSSSIVTAPAI